MKKILALIALMAIVPTILMSAKPKILITGHKGYIGSAVMKALEKEYDVIGYDMKDGDDILDYEKLKKRMKGVDIVIHEAAIPAPVEGKTYDDYFRTNVEGSHNVARAAHEMRVKRLIYASSTTVYGIEGGIPFSYPITENQQHVSQYLKADDLTARDIDLSYHTSKIMAEQIMAWYGLNKKMQVIALRYGPTDKVMTGAHVSLENVVQATVLSVKSPREFWYEPFTIVDGDILFMSIEKARTMLGYDPKPATYSDDVVIKKFSDRVYLDNRLSPKY